MTTLKFREDGTFKILQLTDIHWQNGETEDLQTRACIERVVHMEQPDLLILTGDVIYSLDCKDPIASYHTLSQLIDSFGIPWATVFGNHDTEYQCTKEELIAVQRQYNGCLTRPGPALGDRLGNYTLMVHNRAANALPVMLYMLDTGATSSHPHVGGYAWVTREQIEWYRNESGLASAGNGNKPLRSLAFLHIPLPEYEEVWNTRICYGNRFEQVCSPRLNSGLFAAMVESGDIQGVFAGHDHINDYWGELHGVRLCYGRATGYNTYGKDNFARGARVIRLNETKEQFDTWIVLDNGETIMHQPEHQPERNE